MTTSTTDEDFDGKTWNRKTKAQIKEEQYWEFIADMRKRPLLKCPLCQFKNVYVRSIEHHIEYKHKREEVNE